MANANANATTDDPQRQAFLNVLGIRQSAAAPENSLKDPGADPATVAQRSANLDDVLRPYEAV